MFLNIRAIPFSNYLTYFITLLNSSRGLNKVTELASQLISTPALHYSPSPWKVVLHHQGVRPLLFTNSSLGSFMSHRMLWFWTPATQAMFLPSKLICFSLKYCTLLPNYRKYHTHSNIGHRSKPEHRAHGCLKHGEQRHLYSVYKIQWPQEWILSFVIREIFIPNTPAVHL